jgi:hypothetical protein
MKFNGIGHGQLIEGLINIQNVIIKVADIQGSRRD